MAKQTPTLKTTQSTACGDNIIYNNQLRLNYSADVFNICKTLHQIRPINRTIRMMMGNKNTTVLDLTERCTLLRKSMHMRLYITITTIRNANILMQYTTAVLVLYTTVDGSNKENQQFADDILMILYSTV
jgi:hypothetical protein